MKGSFLWAISLFCLVKNVISLTCWRPRNIIASYQKLRKMSFEILKKFILTAVVSTVHLYELIFDSGYIYDFVTCLVET